MNEQYTQESLFPILSSALSLLPSIPKVDITSRSILHMLDLLSTYTNDNFPVVTERVEVRYAIHLAEAIDLCHSHNLPILSILNGKVQIQQPESYTSYQVKNLVRLYCTYYKTLELVRKGIPQPTKVNEL